MPAVPHLSLELTPPLLPLSPTARANTEDVIFHLLTRKASLTDSDATIPASERFNTSATSTPFAHVNKPLPPAPNIKPKRKPPPRFLDQTYHRPSTAPTPRRTSTWNTNPGTSSLHPQYVPAETAMAFLKYIEVLDAQVGLEVARVKQSIHQVRVAIHDARTELVESQSYPRRRSRLKTYARG